VLQAARRGEYASVTLRRVKPGILERYFTQVGDIHRVNPEVKALVRFSQLNLSDPRKISLINNVDVIFCRNVMIYFSDEVKRRLVRHFFNTLRHGGYLYIGHAESLHRVSRAFKLVYFRNALVYRKETVPQASAADASGRDVVARGRTVHDSAASTARALDLLSKIKPVSVRK
jgi:chemotaxis protein methyltransferase CheR